MTSPFLPRPRSWKTPGAFIALVLFILPATFGCSKEQSSSQPTAEGPKDTTPLVARINGTEIHESDLAIAVDDLGNEIKSLPDEQQREQAIGYLVDITAAAKVAQEQKVADDPEFTRRLNFVRQKLLMAVLLQKVGHDAVNDEALHKVYDKAIASMTGVEEVRARHILVESEDEAKTVVDQIRGGADFAEVAKEKSKDPNASTGGDLGYFTKDQMVPEFAEVAFKMFPGQVSNPVKTQFGWHVIKVEDRRQKPVPKFDDVKAQLEAYVSRQAQQDFISSLRVKAQVVRLDKPASQNGIVLPGAPGTEKPAAPQAAAPAAPPAEAPMKK